MNFNEAQQQAVTHKDGPMMVLAGPGSGKTMVITGRTRTLIEEYGIPPEQVLVITFTKAAATEMKERFTRMMGASCGVRFSTFHSLFFLILRAAYGYKPEQIIREEQQYAFFREMIQRLQLETGDEKDFIRDLIAEISRVKSEEIDLAHYYSMNCPENTFKELYRAYDEFVRGQGLIDFDDMMLLCKELFEARPDILAGWQSRFRYILIDEFQDINQLQYRLIRLLAAPEDNLFIVGDDDQSIYRFRGARPEIMLQFPQDYPDAKQVLLDQNYRSTENILTAAGRVIVNNKKRFPKTIQAASGEQGPPVIFREYPDRHAENEAIAREILRLHTGTSVAAGQPTPTGTAATADQPAQPGIPLSQMAILYRTNLESRSMAETLMSYNIPFIARETVPNLYEHWISQNILDYLRLARLLHQRPEEGAITTGQLSEIRAMFSHIMNRPNRYLTRDSLPDTVKLLTPPPPSDADILAARGAISRRPRSLITRYLDLWKLHYKDKDWMTDRLEKLEYDLTRLASLDPYAGIHYIRNVIGYDEFLKSYAEFRRISLEELTAQLEELQDSARAFPSLAAWEKHMQTYTEELKTQRLEQRSQTDAVTLSTMHASKGLEYQVVFLPDAVEGITPYKKALKDEEMEEERRLFYVALTRAKEYLYLITVRSLFGKQQTPSRFLGEIKFPLAELKPGVGIVHKTYGSGTVQSVTRGKITIYFDKIRKERTLDLQFCISNQLLALTD